MKRGGGLWPFDAVGRSDGQEGRVLHMRLLVEGSVLQVQSSPSRCRAGHYRCEFMAEDEA